MVTEYLFTSFDWNMLQSKTFFIFQDETSDASRQRQTAGRRTGDASERKISANQVLKQCSG
jgi:hypothetical protein